VVGVGPGFSAFEFGAFGVPVNERHARLTAGFEVVRRALAEPEIMFEGTRLAIHPRPYTRPHPRFYWASTTDESLRKASAEGSGQAEGVRRIIVNLFKVTYLHSAAGRHGQCSPVPIQSSSACQRSRTVGVRSGAA
jgi:hypothetical protein